MTGLDLQIKPLASRIDFEEDDLPVGPLDQVVPRGARRVRGPGTG